MSIRFLSKGPADQVSGGYLYNRYLMEHLRLKGVDLAYYSDPQAIDRFSSEDTVIVDSLIIEETAERLLSTSATLVLLLHVVPECHHKDCGNRESAIEALYRRSRIVVTGDSTLTFLREKLTDQGIDAVKIEPGVPAHWRSKGRYAATARRLLTVANYIGGKGIGRVLDVLARLKHLPWCWTVHGNGLDRSYFACVAKKAASYGLTDRVKLLGPISHAAVNEQMVAADLLVHFSGRESYSMVTAEAIACGLPVLSHRTGNFGVFSRSGLVRYLEHDGCETEALGALIEDEQAYGRLRRIGQRDQRTWEDVGCEFLAWLGGPR